MMSISVKQELFWKTSLSPAQIVVEKLCEMKVSVVENLISSDYSGG